MNKIKKYFYEINTKKISNKRIVLLTDIHYYDREIIDIFNILLKEIEALNPDFICIAGDLIDNSQIHNREILLIWLKELGKIAKTIISIGNHELLNRKTKKVEFNEILFERISEMSNVIIVDNASVDIEDIHFMGLTLPAKYFYQDNEPDEFFIKYINKKFSKLDNKRFNVLLCHTPLAICKDDVISKVKIASSLDLVLSGHTHGGITPEFLKPHLKNKGLYSPLRKIWFEDAYGHLKRRNIDIIISGGITKLSRHNAFHFLNSLFLSEITIIDIK